MPIDFKSEDDTTTSTAVLLLCVHYYSTVVMRRLRSRRWAGRNGWRVNFEEGRNCSCLLSHPRNTARWLTAPLSYYLYNAVCSAWWICAWRTPPCEGLVPFVDVLSSLLSKKTLESHWPTNFACSLACILWRDCVFACVRVFVRALEIAAVLCVISQYNSSILGEIWGATYIYCGEVENYFIHDIWLRTWSSLQCTGSNTATVVLIVVLWYSNNYYNTVVVSWY